MTYQVGVRELSGYIGVSESRAHQLVTDGVFKKDESGKLDLRVSVRAYIELKTREQERIKDEESGLDFKSYAERDSYYKSEDRRISLMEKTGQLYNREQVEESFYTLVELTREAFLILPDVLEREASLQPKQLKAVEKFIDKKLKSLANESKRLKK